MIAALRRNGAMVKVLRVGLMAVFLALLPIPQPVQARNRQAAREAYKKAVDYHRQLLDIPRDERAGKKYRYAIFLYRRVLDHDPTYGGSDDALFAIASLHDEMAARFDDDRALGKSIYYYEFLAREYPLTKHRTEALRRAGQLRREKERREAPPEPVAQFTGDPATVTEIRYWSNEDYTRVVVQLDREVEFEKNVLSNPDRVYFDLKNARIRSNVDPTYDVNGVFLKKVRVGENQPGLVRVVLDFDKISSSTVFALYDPFRIVVDTRGPRSAGGVDSTVKTAEAVISLGEDSSSRAVVTEKPAAPARNVGGDLSLTRVLGLKVGRVALDPGHGGRDTGTIGPSGLREKDLVLDIARRVKELIEKRLGAEVVLTREDDRFIPLEQRTAIANQEGADLFVSIHANSSRRRSVSGVETFFLSFATGDEEREVASRENATSQRNIRELENLLRKIALGDYKEESRDLAYVVQKSLHQTMAAKKPKWKDRGVKKAPFIVLINSTMPSVLTEIGFISNPSDEKYLKKDEARDQVAEALYKGIEEYFRALGGRPASDRTAASSGR